MSVCKSLSVLHLPEVECDILSHFFGDVAFIISLSKNSKKWSSRPGLRQKKSMRFRELLFLWENLSAKYFKE